MKLLLRDERCNNLLKDTISLLLFLKQHKQQLPGLKVEVSRDVKVHTLVLPQHCIKGIDDIYEFFVKYTNAGNTGNAGNTCNIGNTGNTGNASGYYQDDRYGQECSDLSSYYQKAIDAGDEEREKNPFYNKNTAPAAQPASNRVHDRYPPQKAPTAVRQMYYEEEEDEMDIHDHLAAALKQGGTI